MAGHQERSLVGEKCHINGIDADDRRQGGGSRPTPDEFADVHRPGADPAGDRRRHPAEAEIELRLREHRPVFLERRGGHVVLGQDDVDLLLRDRAAREEGLIADALALQFRKLRLLPFDLRLGLIAGDQVGAVVDLEERIADAHILPIVEVDRRHKSPDARLEIDRLHRRGVPGELDRVGHLGDDRPGDDDLRRRRGDNRRARASAPGQRHEQRGRSDGPRQEVGGSKHGRTFPGALAQDKAALFATRQTGRLKMERL